MSTEHIALVVDRLEPDGTWSEIFRIGDHEAPAGPTPRYRVRVNGEDPPTPVLLAQTGYDDETPVGLYTSREAAQVVIDQHDAAVRAAVADGKLGICHEGDLYVWDGPTDAPVAAFFDPGLYLWPYLPQTEAAPPAPGWDGSA